MIKAIIFDFFDVLRTDAYKAWLHANTIPHEGAYFEASRQQDIGEITNEQFIERLSDLTGRLVTHEEIDATAMVDREVVDVVEALRRTYKTALLSNAPSALIRGILKEHRLEQYFDEIVISSEVGMVKPDAEIFRYVLRRLGVAAEEAVFIDDNPGHVKAAEGVGISAIRFVSAPQLVENLRAMEIRAS